MTTTHWLQVEYPILYILFSLFAYLLPFIFIVAGTIWFAFKTQNINVVQKGMPYILGSVVLCVWMVVTFLFDDIEEMYTYRSSLNLYAFQVDVEHCKKLQQRGVALTRQSPSYCLFNGNYKPNAFRYETRFILQNGKPTGLNETQLEMAQKREWTEVKREWLSKEHQVLEP